MVSVIVIAYNRKEELKYCIDILTNLKSNVFELIIVDNNSTDGTENLFEGADNFTQYKNVKYHKLTSNLGVAGGRNYGIRQATGDILVFVDDDALLEPADALDKVLQKFADDPRLGILAFKVVNYYSKTIQREEFPHIDKSLDPDKEFETSYYIGAGHAIRRELFEKCGLYPDDYFYGLEELDLSFRAIDKGYKIVYTPDIMVWHKKSPKGRMADDKKWIFSYRNRLAISYKYLCRRHLWTTAFIWFLQIARKSGSLVTPLKGLAAFMDYRKGLIRKPISDVALRKIAALKGRLWY